MSEYPTREKSILIFGEFCGVLFSLMKNNICVPRIYCKAGGRCFSNKKKKKKTKVMRDESLKNTRQKKKLINIEIFLLQRKTNASGEQKPLSVICKAGLLL